MKMNKSVQFPAKSSPSGHKSNGRMLPSERNSGQKNHMSIAQNCVPGAGSPTPTQALKGARGKLGDM